jgi:mannose-6-phosphate isomerase
MSALRTQRVKAGETYFIPAGLPHAIGKGILIAEIQQNCDLTYRVYDYDRVDAAGNKRELHVKKALEVIRPFSDEEIETLRYSNATEEYNKDRLLAHCPFFRVEKLVLSGNTLPLPSQKMLHLLCLEGAATLTHNGENFPIVKGDSFLIPACLRDVMLSGSATLLLSSVD